MLSKTFDCLLTPDPKASASDQGAEMSGIETEATQQAMLKQVLGGRLL